MRLDGCANIFGKGKVSDMTFFLLAGGLLIIIIAVLIAVISSIVSAVAADQDIEE